MSVTVTSRLIEDGPVQAYELVAVSTLEEPTFYWWEWGVLVAVTRLGTRVVSVGEGVSLQVEVFDSAGDVPAEVGHPPFVVLEWGPVEGAEGYAVLDNPTSTLLARFGAGDPWYSWQSPVLENAAEYDYAVYAVHGAEILGMTSSVSGVMIRNPAPPVLSELAYDGDDLTGEVDGDAFTAAALGLDAGVWWVSAAVLSSHALISGMSAAVRLRVNGDGESIGVPPADPTACRVVSTVGGVLVSALYDPDSEGETLEAVVAARATHWLIYISVDGTDPLLDSPTVLAMDSTDDARLVELGAWDSMAVIDGAPVRVAVKTRRDEGGGVTVDSEGAATASVTRRAVQLGPVQPQGFLGRSSGVEREWAGVPAVEVNNNIDVAKGLRWRYQPGRTILEANGVLCLALIWRGNGDARNGVYVPSTFEVNVEAYAGGAAGNAFEVVSAGTWDGSNKEVLLQAGGVVLARWDVVTMVVTVNEIESGEEGLLGLGSSNVSRARYAESAAGVWDQAGEIRRVLLRLKEDGVLQGWAWDFTKSVAEIEDL